MFARAIGDHLITSNSGPEHRQTRPATPNPPRSDGQPTQGTSPGNRHRRRRLHAGRAGDQIHRRDRRPSRGSPRVRLRDLDDERCTVLLRKKKNDKDGSEQPASPGLLRAVRTSPPAAAPSTPNDAVFRYKPKKGERIGRPLTRRRFNPLADRWQATLPFAAPPGVTPTHCAIQPSA